MIINNNGRLDVLTDQKILNHKFKGGYCDAYTHRPIY